VETDGERPPPGPLTTLTHARLRAEQGDLGGARKLLREILELHPGLREASDMLEKLGSGRGTPGREEEAMEEAPAVPATPADLAEDFRAGLGSASPSNDRKIRRLRKLLERIAEVRGEGHA
jgi:hypothetical protein